MEEEIFKSPIKELLSSCSLIIKDNDNHLVDTGEEYNLLSILGLVSDEQVHSKIIVSLLKPDGKHRQGELFLRLFIETLNDAIPFDVPLSCANANVKREEPIGEINNKGDNPSGGRLDILIYDADGHEIVIENKIFAKDQYRQLERYYTYLTRDGKKAEVPILYLTPLGHAPSPDSIKNPKRIEGHYICVSYKDFITKWLEKCESENIPDYLRNIIQQYQNIVNRITNQSFLQQMRNRLIQEAIEKDKESLESAFQIVAAYEDLKIDIETKFWQYIFDNIGKDLNPHYSAGFNSSPKADIESCVRDYLTKKGDTNKLIGIDVIVGQYQGHDLLLRICAYERLLYYLHFKDIPDNRDNTVSIIEGILPSEWNWNSPNSRIPKEWIKWCRPAGRIIDIYDFGKEMREFMYDKQFADDIIKEFLSLRNKLKENLSKLK